MPRTLNPELHQLRRDAFLDVAQRLIQTKGYERMSIQDVLDELETSRGALYHYFDSKEALLDGVVARFADAGMAAVAPVLADPELPALRKLDKVLGAIAAFKAGQRELVLAINEVWRSDSNALAREKLRRLYTSRLQPILAAIIRQGIEEGTVRDNYPEELAQVLVYLFLGYGEYFGEMLVARRRSGTVDFDTVLRTYAALKDAFERILGIPPGSVTLTDEAVLRYWFG